MFIAAPDGNYYNLKAVYYLFTQVDSGVWSVKANGPAGASKILVTGYADQPTANAAMEQLAAEAGLSAL